MLTERLIRLAIAFAFCWPLPLLAAFDDVSLILKPEQSSVVQTSDATAAYAVDPLVAYAQVAGGKLTVTGRAPGRTTVIVVTTGSNRSISVTVKPSAGGGFQERSRQASTTAVDVRYASATQQAEMSIDSVFDTKNGKRSELRVVAVNSLGSTWSGTTGRYARWLSYSSASPKRKWTLFDSSLEVSPLTVSGVIVRGLHYVDPQWDVHAGVTSGTSFASTFLATESQTVAGAQYRKKVNARSAFTPAVYFASSTETRRGGGIFSLGYHFEDGERLRIDAEVGLSRGVGAATDLTFNGEKNQLRFRARYRPATFAVIGPSSLAGMYAEGSWRTNPTASLSAETSGSVNDYVIGPLEQRSANGQQTFRLSLNRVLAISSGVSYGQFSTTAGQTIDNLAIPSSLQWHTPRFGVDLSHRFTRNSASNRGGNGYGAVTTASIGALYATAYYDHQAEAPTLEVIFRDDPALAAVLDQLGLTVTSPEDLARLLRDNPALASLGVIERIFSVLSTAVVRGGVELSLLGSSTSRQKLRFRYGFVQTDTVARSTRSETMTLSASRQFFERTEVYAGVHAFRSEHGGDSQSTRLWEIGVRHVLDASIPKLFQRRGTISGLAFADDEATGKWEPSSKGVEGVVVELDGDRRVTTDRGGRFAFHDVDPGVHRIAGIVGNGVYFTTPASVDRESGQSAVFGITATPARLVGSVTDDGGRGVPAALIVMRAGQVVTSFDTDDDGSFTAVLEPGDYEIVVDNASLPSGYTLAVRSRQATVARRLPARLDFKAAVARTISGRISLANSSKATISIEQLGLNVTADAEGRFAIRSMPAGSFTLVARIDSKVISRKEVVVPPSPGVVRVELGL